MNARGFDISRLSINLISAVALFFGVFKVGLPIVVNLHDLSRDIRELRTTIEASSRQSAAAHEDAESALRDSVDKAARLKVMENRFDSLAHWMSWEWAYVHGRIDRQPWHNPRTPPPDFSVAPTPEGS